GTYAPCASVTRMIISPLGALTGTPLTSTLTNSSAISGRPRSELVLHDAAAAVVDHVLEFMAIVLQEALHRPGGCVSERADGVAFDAIRHVQEESQLLASRLAGQHPFEEAVHPTRAFAAGRALSAGLGHVEAGDALQHAHHAGRLVHHNDSGRTDRGTRGLQRVV